MNNEPTDQELNEVKEDVSSLVPVNAGINMPQVSTRMDIKQVAKDAEAYMEVQDTLRKISLKVTNVNDWIDQAGKPYLQYTGTAKIAVAFGVSFQNCMYEKHKEKDDDGEYYIVEVVGDVVVRGVVTPETGTGSGRDSFFGMRNKKWLPIGEVDQTNIRKKALTNFRNRGIKAALGLSFTWEEIEKISDGKITKEACTVFSYGGKGKAKPPVTPELIAKRKEIKKMLDKLFGKDAGNKLIKQTKFTGYDGKSDALKLTEKEVAKIYPGLKKKYDESQVDKGTGEMSLSEKEQKKVDSLPY